MKKAEEIGVEYDLDLVKFCANEEVLREHLAARDVPDERLDRAVSMLYRELYEALSDLAMDDQARCPGCPVADNAFASWQPERGQAFRTILWGLVSVPTFWAESERGRELIEDLGGMADLASDLTISTHSPGGCNYEED